MTRVVNRADGNLELSIFGRPSVRNIDFEFGRIIYRSDGRIQFVEWVSKISDTDLWKFDFRTDGQIRSMGPFVQNSFQTKCIGEYSKMWSKFSARLDPRVLERTYELTLPLFFAIVSSFSSPNWYWKHVFGDKTSLAEFQYFITYVCMWKS